MEENALRSYAKVRSIEEDGVEDVYCLSVPSTGNFVANGIVVKNCDALRYAVASAFKTGDFGHPDEHLSYDQLRRQIYPDSPLSEFISPESGYF